MDLCEYDGWEFYQTGHHQFRADYEKKNNNQINLHTTQSSREYS